MDRPGYTREEITRHGEEIYERAIRAHVEDDYDGEFLAVDIESGDYEVSGTPLEVSRRLHNRRPEAVLHLMRVGRPSAFRFGRRRLLSEGCP